MGDHCYSIPMNPRKIGDLVTVIPRPTVVRLDDLDGERRDWIVDGYHLTPDVERFLASIRAWLGRPEGGGAFLVGPYGSGKSHFLAFLTAEIRAGRLGPAESPEVVTISLVNFRADRALEDIVSDAVGLTKRATDRRRSWSRISEDHPQGLMLVIDELSEFLRSKADPAAFNEDVRFLQFLGEWSRDHRLWILAALQEEIEHTGRLASALYRKIKDRYPLRLLLTPSHIRDLVADHLLIRRDGFDSAVAELARDLEGALPKGAVSSDAVTRLYPVHPATLDFLEEVRDVFSQTRGAVDMILSRLLGDSARGIDSLLERPWGEMLTPDVIVDHFSDLFELQPELLPITQRLIPRFQRRMDELFENDARRKLAWRLLKLLIVTHLSPRREGLTASEATALLAVRATTISPERNTAILGRILETLAEDGAFVRSREDLFFLDLSDEGVQTLEHVLPQEIQALRSAAPAAVWGILLEALEDDPFVPTDFPTDRWKMHTVRWHFHERRVPIYLGGGDPPDPPDRPSLCIRTPWEGGDSAVGMTTLVPAPVEPDDDLLELAAMIRLRKRGGTAVLGELLDRRIERRIGRAGEVIHSAFLEAVLVDSDGGRHTPPRPSTREPFTRWLDQLTLWILRRRYPSFERTAPTAGPLPKEAYRRFVAFAFEHGLEGETDDEWVTVIREGYLVPMGLMQRRGWLTTVETRLDRNELLRLIRPLIETRPTPEKISEHLKDSVFGLVPDQVDLLLIFLHLVGEIDILKGRRSYREMYRSIPLPGAYDSVVPDQALPAESIRDLEILCKELGIRRPPQWSAATLGTVLDRLRRSAGDDRKTLEGLLALLEREDDGSALAERIRRYLAPWSILDSGDAPAAIFGRFLATVTGVRGLASERSRLLDLSRRMEGLLARRRHLTRILEHPHLDPSWDETIAERLRTIGPAPGIDVPDDLARWLQEAESAYEAFALGYAKNHDAYWRALEDHDIWTWRPPVIARSRLLGLEESLHDLERARTAAGNLRCRRLIDSRLGPRCACGFDGRTAPIETEIEAFTAARRRIMESIEGFFAQQYVIDAVRSWAAEDFGSPEGTTPYLEGRARYPEIDDPELFDRHLSGMQLVREVTAEDVLEGVAGTTLTPEEVLRRLETTLRRLESERIRIGLPAPVDHTDQSVVRWCIEQALRGGVPLPEGLFERLPATAAEGVEPAWVGADALSRLEDLGLGDPIVDRICRWIIDGTVSCPNHIDIPPPVRAAREIHSPSGTDDVEERARRARILYLAAPRMTRIARGSWTEYLETLARAPLAQEPPDLFDVLDGALDHQWVVVDCLGIPLLEAALPVLERRLARWSTDTVSFARVDTRTTTDRYWGRLAEKGLNHPMVKVNAIDRLIHSRRLDFADLERLAAAELEVALGRVVDGFEDDEPILVFADHGFRLDPDGKHFVHGGSSVLERTVPVIRFTP